MALSVSSSGIDSFDELLESGLAAGDNIVWTIDDPAMANLLTAAYEDSSAEVVTRLCFGTSTSCIHNDGAERIHLGDRADWADVAEVVLGLDIGWGSRLIFERFDSLAATLDGAQAVEVYRSICPRLFDRGAIAYWYLDAAVAPSPVIDAIARIAQCVFEIRSGQLRIVKAEGRSRRLQGMTVFITADGESITVSKEHIVGRLGEGLRRTRSERNLTQAQLSALAGVTPAAISQAETGRRGLSLDTLVTMCETLDIGIDDLLGTGKRPDPDVARHDRRPATGSAVALFDDPRGGARTFLQRIGAHESVTPPLDHSGAELLLVAQGLVLADLKESTPVLRAGDALRATRSTLRRITNLDDHEAVVFWVALDDADSEPVR